MELKKTFNWSYIVTDNEDIYIGKFWKKRIYKKCLKYARKKLSKDVSEFIGTKMYNVFNLSLDERTLYNNWIMNVDVPKFKDSEISRELIVNKCFSNRYLVKCVLKCKVDVSLRTI